MLTESIVKVKNLKYTADCSLPYYIVEHQTFIEVVENFSFSLLISYRHTVVNNDEQSFKEVDCKFLI